jgi:hypothetical protein
MARPPQGLAFRLLQRPIEGLVRPVSYIEWDPQPVTMTANEALGAADQGEPTAKEDAVGFLRAILAAGPVKVGDIETQARSACLLAEKLSISQSKPFRSARKALSIKPYQKAGGWWWELPEH